MTVIVVPTNVQNSATVTCILCLQTVPLSATTAGSRYADGRQAFACNKHRTNHRLWVTTWTLFEAEQRGAGLSPRGSR